MGLPRLPALLTPPRNGRLRQTLRRDRPIWRRPSRWLQSAPSPRPPCACATSRRRGRHGCPPRTPGADGRPRACALPLWPPCYRGRPAEDGRSAARAPFPRPSCYGDRPVTVALLWSTPLPRSPCCGRLGLCILRGMPVSELPSGPCALFASSFGCRAWTSVLCCFLAGALRSCLRDSFAVLALEMFHVKHLFAALLPHSSVWPAFSSSVSSDHGVLCFPALSASVSGAAHSRAAFAADSQAIKFAPRSLYCRLLALPPLPCCCPRLRFAPS